MQKYCLDLICLCSSVPYTIVNPNAGFMDDVSRSKGMAAVSLQLSHYGAPIRWLFLGERL